MKSAPLLKSKDECHNITSDIIESTFGVYKSIQPKNKHCGITPIVLALPLYGKVTDSKKREERLTSRRKWNA